MRRGTLRPRSRGFTLVEVLLAIAILAVLAVLSWRGIDGLLRTQEAVRERMTQVSVLQTALAQWTSDLEAMVEQGNVPAMDFDGRVLRLVRVDASLPGSPLRVVGWSQRAVAQAHQGRGSWMRWQSPPVQDRQALQQAWQGVQQWAQSSASGHPHEVAVVGLDGWQLMYFRNNAWTHPLSSAGADGAASAVASAGPSATSQAGALPDGVRLVLRMASDHPLAGEITRDWMRPVSTGDR